MKVISSSMTARATLGALSFTGGVAVGPNGAVYLADGTAHGRRVQAGLCGLALDLNPHA